MDFSSSYDSFFKTTADAKNALLALFEREGSFVDRDKMKTEGILSDSIGLISLMQLLVAFSGADQGKVITPEDPSRISGIVAALLPRIYDTVRADGYLFTPIFDKGKTAKIFSAEEHIGSTDTATWVMSLSILIWYAQKEGLFEISQELRDQAAFLIGDSLKTLLDSQRSEDGTWGFGTWSADDESGQAERSLYFTYSVASAIADFFYYVRGDIENPNDDPNVGSEEYWDHELLEILRAQIGRDAMEAVVRARERMQMWLLKDCLPLLPKLASCRSLTPKENKVLGIWDTSSELEPGSEHNFFNLYYTYYLIDMMINSEVDLLFNSFDFSSSIQTILESKEPCGLPGEQLLLSYRENSAFTQQDKLYYLGLDRRGRFHREDQHIRDLVENSLQQAIHDARAMYMVSRRTRSFWNQSELKVEWHHDDASYTELDVRKAVSGGSITDPAFAPMALRANVNYVYFLTQKPEFILNTLFDSIRQEAYDPAALRELMGDEFDEKSFASCVPALWDTENFSLFITERSIEALVDYFDYLQKYESLPEPVVQTKVQVEKSSFETALEEKICSFLSSPEGAAAIAGAMGAQNAAPAAAQSGDAFLGSMRAFLKTASRDLSQAYSDSSEPEELVALLVACFEKLQSASALRKVRKHEKDFAGAEGTELNSRTERSNKMLQAQITELFDVLLDRMDPNNSLAWLFEKLLNAAQDNKL